MSYLEHILILILIYSILAQGMNLVLGYTGLLNLGQIGFYAVGAYTSALLSLAHVPFLASFFLAGMAATVAGLLVGVPSLRLKGHYFAIATLGFGEIIHAILLNWSSLTRGALGLPGIPRPEFLGIALDSQEKYVLLAFVVTMISLFVMFRVIHAPFGRTLETIREDEIAAQALGIHTFRFKLEGFLLAAFFSGIAGSVYAHYIQFIDPNSFQFTDVVTLVLMVVLGGMGNFWGAVLGSALILFIFQPLRFLPLPPGITGPLRQLLYAVILVAIMLFRSKGLIPRRALRGKINLPT